MKHQAAGIAIVILFAVMLVFPQEVFNGASEGLLLWFQVILPTLLPFIIITNLLLCTDSIHYISRAFGTLLCKFFKVSESGSFAVIVGFLCGYPMGAKVSADLVTSGYISESEGRYLLSFCNNTSPVFILNFIVWKTLGIHALMLPSLIILIASPIICSFIFRRFQHSGIKNHTVSRRALPSEKDWGTDLIDNCIMSSFETITKVGGYIMLFSVILALLQSLPWQPPGMKIILPLLEVTNGIVLLGKSDLPFAIQYPAILSLTSFGGFCAIAQTKCMIQKTNLSIFHYTIEKLVTAGVTSLLAILYLKVV